MNFDAVLEVAKTVKFISKERILLCTGAVMADSAKELLGLLPLEFQPKHSRNLANEFRCFSNYPCAVLK